MRVKADAHAIIGMLHRSPGYRELEGYVELDGIPCLIMIELIKRIKNGGIISLLGQK